MKRLYLKFCFLKRKLLGSLILFLLTVFAAFNSYGQVIEVNGTTVTMTFTSDGTFNVPPGVTTFTVYGWGGGGAGGDNTLLAGGGGGGGAYASLGFSAPLASTYLVDVGSGGFNPFPTNTGSNGGNTYFGTAPSPNMLVAPGGQGGQSENGGAGGSGASGTTTANGLPGTDAVGVGLSYGGEGGNSATGIGGIFGAGGPANNPGLIPGGGGGGANSFLTGVNNGSPGAVGQIVITFNTTCILGLRNGLQLYSAQCQSYAANRSTLIGWNLDLITFLGSTSNVISTNSDVASNWTVTSDFDADKLSDGCGLTGSMVVTYSLINQCGSSLSASTTFTIYDNTPPSFTRPIDITVNEAANCTYDISTGVTGTPTIAADDCAVAPMVVGYADVINPGSCVGQKVVSRVWTVTDDCGNLSTQTQTITINDVTGPVISFPGAQVAQCDGLGNTASLTAFIGAATASDCSGVANIVSSTQTADLCCETSITTVTWVATDGCGNMTTQTSTFTIIDTIVPDLTVPGPMSVECDGAGNTASLTAFIADYTATDICCTTVNTVTNTSFAAGCCGNLGTWTVSWTSTDGCSNAITKSSTFTIVDTTMPALAVPVPMTVECDGSGNTASLTAFLAGATATDVCCNSSVTISHTQTFTDLCCETGIWNVRWTATDCRGNQNSATSTFTIVDTTKPVLDLPDDDTVQCDGAGNTQEFAEWKAKAEADDVCCGDITVTSTQSWVTSCCEAGKWTVIFTATDGCGNAISDTRSFTIVDTTPPTLTPPDNDTVECDGAGNTDEFEIWKDKAEATDICCKGVTISSTQSWAGACCNTGVWTVVFTATDACSNATVATRTFTIVDTTKPTLNVPGNSTVECDGDGNTVDYAAWKSGASANDMCCGTATLTLTENFVAGCCDTGVWTVVWTAVDGCGNSISETRTFTILDTTAPAINCEIVPIYIDCNGLDENRLAANNWHVQNIQKLCCTPGIVVDLCCNSVSITSDYSFEHLSDGCGLTGTLEATYYATDPCGNTASVTFTLIIRDITAPTFTVPANTTVNADANCAIPTPATTGDVTNEFDVCTDPLNPLNATYSDSWVWGSCVGQRIITRVWTLKDNCDNATVKTQTITVNDVTPPVLVVPVATTVECNPTNNPAAYAAWKAGATSEDRCSGTRSITVSEPFTDNCCETGVYTVNFMTVDACGNATSAVSTFTIVDTQKPTLNAPANATVECGPTNADTFVAWGNTASATDVCCGAITVTRTQSWSQACCTTGIWTVIFTATDGCGNSISATRTYTIEDTTKPTLNPPANETVECGPTNAATFASWKDSATATDICCGTIAVTNSQSWAAACCTTGVYTVIFTATDACGNSISATRMYTIVDTTRPVLTTPANATVECDGAGNTQQYADWKAEASATDICCGTIEVAKSESSVAPCCDTKVWTVIFTATDACGNSTSQTKTFTIVDTQKPTLNPPVSTTVECGPTNAATFATWKASATATDVCCESVSVINSQSWVAACCSTGVYTVIFTATDGCGNSISATRTYTIVDTTIPTLTPPVNSTVECDGSGNTTQFATWKASASATDICCGTTAVTSTQSWVGACCNTGVWTVIFTTTDACGNSTSATRTFTIVDTTAPVIHCILPSMTYECKGLDLNIAAAEDWNQDNILKLCCLPNVSDVCCANWTVASNFDYKNLSDGCGNTGVLTVTYTVTDLCGNSSTTTAVFTLKDSYTPTFTRPADITINADAECEYNADPSITGDVVNEADMCSPLIQAVYSDAVAAGSCAGKRVITRTWTLTDGCNAAAPQVQTITVLDVTAPVLWAPANVTVQCDGVGNTSAFETWWLSAYANDACVGSVTPTVATQWTTTCCNAGGWTVTFTATDPCGNATSLVRTFTIVDTTAPEFTVPAATTIYTDASCNYNSAPAITGDVTDEWDLCCSGPRGDGGDGEDEGEGEGEGGGEGNGGDYSPSVTPINATYLDVVANGSCTGAKVITRTWTLMDGCGNYTVKTQIITVLDNIKPTVNVRSSSNPIVVNLVGVKTANCLDCLGKWTLNPQNYYDLTYGGTVTTTYDNCTAYSNLQISASPNTFLCADAVRMLPGLARGVVPVVITVVDNCGNVATATSYVKVVDNTAPTMSCKSITVALDAAGKAFIYPADVNNGNDRESVPPLALTYNGLEGGSWDACGIDSAWVSKQAFDCSNIGANVVTLYMGDPSAKYWTGSLATNINVGTCTATVMIVDNTPPVVAAVGNVVTTVAAGVCTTKVAYPTVSGTDVCGTTSVLVSGLGKDGMFPLGTSTEVWLTTDGGGNAVTTTFTVTVNTTNAEPTINQISAVSLSEDTAPATVQLSGIGYGNDCTAQSVAVTVASTNPALLTSAVLSYTPGDATGSIVHTFAANASGSAVVTVTVKDNSGSANDTKVMSYTVTVAPVNDPPVLVAGKAIADVQINSAKTKEIAIPSALGAYFDDIDGDALTLTVTKGDGTAVPSWITVAAGKITIAPLIYNMGKYTIKVTAKDPSGAMATDEFEIEVLGYVVGIDPTENEGVSITTYPNPTNGPVTVEVTGDVQKVDVAVWNAAGQQIMRRQFNATRFTIDLSDQVSGMYYIESNTGNYRKVSKVVLEK